MKHFLFKLFLSLVIISGCQTKEEKLSKGEALAFARGIEKQVDDFKIDFLEKNIHFPTLMEKIYLNEKSKKLKGLENGMRNNLSTNNYERSVYDIMGGAGSFKMTRQYEKEGLQHLIFRVHGVNGFNYMDMELVKVEKKTWIADILLFNTGENLSKSMGDLAEKLLEHEGSSIESSLIDNLNRIKEYNRKGEYKNAQTAYLRLPYNIRNNKMYETLYLDILSKISPEEHLAELEKIAKKYQAREGYELMLLDVYLAKKDYDNALACIDGIDSMVRRDPFLDYYRGLINSMKGENEKAVSYFEKVAVSMPDFADNYAELFAHYSSVDDKANAKKYFSTYKTLKGKNPDVVNFYETQYPYLSQ